MHVFTVRVSHCSSSRADTGLQWLFLHPSDDAAAALWCFATGCTFQSTTLSYHAQQCMNEWMNGLHSPLSNDPFPYFGVIHWSSQSLSSAHWVILWVWHPLTEALFVSQQLDYIDYMMMCVLFSSLMPCELFYKIGDIKIQKNLIKY